MVFKLNKVLDTEFSRIPDITIPAGRPGSSTVHSIYDGFFNQDFHCTLIANKDQRGSGYLINELKTVDYFLVFQNQIPVNTLKSIIDKIREIDIVTGAYLLGKNEYKNSDAFLILMES